MLCESQAAAAYNQRGMTPWCVTSCTVCISGHSALSKHSTQTTRKACFVLKKLVLP